MNKIVCVRAYWRGWSTSASVEGVEFQLLLWNTKLSQFSIVDAHEIVVGLLDLRDLVLELLNLFVLWGKKKNKHEGVKQKIGGQRRWAVSNMIVKLSRAILPH